MNRPETGARVAQRSLLATVEITAAASFAHVLAGGHLPNAGFLFAFAAVVFGCCLATIGRFLRLAVAVPTVLVAQVGLHLALDAAPAAHHGAVAAAASQGPLGLTPVMFWAHLITALVTAILLLLQERVIASAVSTWRAVLHRVPLRPWHDRLLVTSRFVVATAAELLRLAPRRGPPLVASAAL